jgi:hypothetical protein
MNDSTTMKVHRARIAELLRSTVNAFVSATPIPPAEAAVLRTETDCLLTLWSSGRLNPVADLHQPAPAKPAPAKSSILRRTRTHHLTVTG